MMNTIEETPPRLLVAIANYGTRNGAYLSRVIDEYRSLSFATHIVVLSDTPRDLGGDIEVVVGLPAKNPWSLPFGHKRIFSERADDYDLFLYAEDDILITQKNLDAFLMVSTLLPRDEIAGFFRFEIDSKNDLFYPDVHWQYHWESESVRSYGDYRFASFTNEHAGCYILTREQLRVAIRSGGYLVTPHRGKYDMPETAATDPYTQCNLKKRICVSHFNDFLVHHLPNKYVGRMGLGQEHFGRQIGELLHRDIKLDAEGSVLRSHPEFEAYRFGKDYYEPARTDMIDLIPTSVRKVLSLGCGWGATEQSLVRGGRKVTAIPLDSTIATCARARGIDIVEGDLSTALAKLGGEVFDCLLASNVLHLLEDPGDVLARCTPLLSHHAIVIAAVPNLRRLPVLWRKLRFEKTYFHLGNYKLSGVHFTSPAVVNKWFKQSGFREERVVNLLPDRAKGRYGTVLKLFAPLLATEIVAIARRHEYKAAGVRGASKRGARNLC